MAKTWLGNEIATFDDLLSERGGKAVCNTCKQEFKELYMTDHGYVCKQHVRRNGHKVQTQES